MILNRQIEGKLEAMREKFPVIVITGPRQSGKTTLVKKMFKDYPYVSLEDIDRRQYALEDPRGFLEDYRQQVIIDEIQNAPDLFSYIQTKADESRETGQYILTGSQNFLLLQKVSQTLAGRAYISRLLPFSYAETAGIFQPDLEDVLYKGGYPPIYDRGIEPADFFPSYIQTYLERDVRNIISIENLHDFSNFISVCAGRCGQVFNASAVSNEIGISHQTVKRWLSVLEASYIVFKLPPWHKNFNKRITKRFKLYFYDTGLAAHLLGLRKKQDLKVHFAKGALFENYIIAECVKNYWNRGLSAPFYFWRENNGLEIDLIIDHIQKIKSIEIKSARTTGKSLFKNLVSFNKITGDKLHIQSFLVYGGEQKENRTAANILPWNNLGELVDS